MDSDTGPITLVADPRVTYDPYNHRWIAVVVINGYTTNSAVLLAVSRTSDPTVGGTNGWNFIRVKADTNVPPTVWADQPTVGFNKDWIVIHGIMFAVGASRLEGSHFWVFNKTNVYAGGSNHTVIPYLNATNGGAIIPAVTYDTNISTLYLLQNAKGPERLLRMFSITGAIGSEALTLVTNYAPGQLTWADQPPNRQCLPQAGTTTLIDAIDARLHNVVYRNGSLWTVHNVFLPATNATRTSVQWWQIDPAQRQVLQRGCIDDTSNRLSYAFPTIAVNKFNDVLIGYSSFSTNQFPSASYSFRAFYDKPINQMRGERVFKAGEEYYSETSWGDYSATVVDPLNDADLWTIQEYTSTNEPTFSEHMKWQTRWAKVAVEFPANDHYSNAVTLAAGGGSLTNVNHRAGKESGETNHAGNPGGASIWYQWTVTNSGRAFVDTVGSSFDNVLGVYTGSAVSSLTLVASDYGSAGEGSSRVFFDAVSNTTYRIAADGYNGISGTLLLNWSNPVAPMIVRQPQSTNVIDNANEDAIFTVEASGALPLLYQWKHEGTNISNATNAIYTITNVRTNHATNYVAVVWNSYGTNTNATASLFVHENSRARLYPIERMSNSIRLHVFGLTNRPYRVDTSTNLSTGWQAIHTNVTSFWFTNLINTNDPMRFYRAVTNN